MGPQTTATTVGLLPLAAIPPQTSRDLLNLLTLRPRSLFRPLTAPLRDNRQSPQMRCASGGEVLWPRPKAAGVADAMIEANSRSWLSLLPSGINLTPQKRLC